MAELDIDKLSVDIEVKSKDAVKALDLLVKSIDKISKVNAGGANNATKVLKEVEEGAKKATNQADKLQKAVAAVGSTSIMRNLAGLFTLSGIGTFLQKSNEYVENLNLFNVAMGEGAKEALDFAQRVQDIMGIDMSNWIRNQGIFNTLIEGFGVTSERANVMSKQLTQLGYDLSSFFNISVADSMQKLQSGISGELEPLRRLGFDLSQTRLQLTATKLGIDQNVASLTQAEKSQLRYYAIMTQVTEAQGDMARTLSTPANQFRILKDNVNMLGRAIGNVFVPLANKIVPVLTAIVQEVRDFVQAIAEMFGFELPEIDYSGINRADNAVDDLAADLDNAGGKAKKLKSYLLGFDELNVFEPNNGSGSGSAVNSLFGDWDFKLPTYDFLGDAEAQVSKIHDMIKQWGPWITAIGAGIATWSISSAFANALQSLGTLTKGQALQIAAGVAFTVTGITLAVETGLDIAKNGRSFMTTFKELVAAVLTGGGITLLASAIGLSGGALIIPFAIGAALAIAVTEITAAYTKSKLEYAAQLKKDLEDRFGTFELTGMNLKLAVDALTTNETTVALGVYVDKKRTTENLAEQLGDITASLAEAGIKLDLGVEIDQDAYNEQMLELVKSSLEYVAGRQGSLLAGIALLPEDSAAYTNLATFATSYYDTAYQTLFETGEKLKTVMSEGFVDGEWVPDKLAEAQQLQKEIAEVISMVNEAKLYASLNAIGIKFSGTNLTADSFKQLTEQANLAIEQSLADNDEWLQGLLVEANLQLKYNLDQGMSETQANKIYDDTVASLAETYRKNVITITDASFNFELDTLKSAFEGEFKDAVNAINVDIIASDLYDGIVGSMSSIQYGDYSTPFENFLTYYANQIPEFIDKNITPQAKDNLQGMYEALKPNTDAWNKLALEYLQEGKKIPSELVAGLNDAQQLAAIAGVQSGYDYILGKAFANDANWLKTLEGAKGVGAELSEEMRLGFAANTDILYDEVNGLVKIITTDGNEIILEATDDLLDNLNTISGGVGITTGRITDYYSSMGAATGSHVNGMVTNVLGKFSQLNTSSLGYSKSLRDALTGDFSTIKNDTTRFISEGVDLILGKFSNLKDDGKRASRNLVDGVAQNISELNANLPNMMNDTYNVITNAFNSAKNKAIETINGIDLKTKEGRLHGADFGLKDSLLEGLGDMQKFTRDNIVNPIQEALNNANFKFPTPHFKWEFPHVTDKEQIKALTAAGIVPVTPTLSVSWYAAGGFPTEGELFVAREAGAELVGAIGGHTAVANNDQIVEAVSLGVYEAVSAAMSGNNGEATTINIRLDGQVIYDDMLRIARSRGANLGQGVFSRG